MFFSKCHKIISIFQDIISKKEQLETEMEDNILVPVSLKFNQKGSSRKLAVICLPIGEDFKETPVEPCHKDVNEDKRKSLRNEHKDLLKRLRRKRRRVRKNNGEVRNVSDLILLVDNKNCYRKSQSI